LAWISCYVGAQTGTPHYFVKNLAIVLAEIEKASQGYALEMVNRVSNLKGREESKYEQLLQLFAEIHVTYRAVVITDSVCNKKFSRMNP